MPTKPPDPGLLEMWSHEIAAFFGALVSLAMVKGSPVTRVVMATCGFIMSIYLAGWVARITGLPHGGAGFLVGLFGMAVASRVWEGIQAVPIAEFWTRLFNRIFGDGGPK